jgi:hypothetical protein
VCPLASGGAVGAATDEVGVLDGEPLGAVVVTDDGVGVAVGDPAGVAVAPACGVPLAIGPGNCGTVVPPPPHPANNDEATATKSALRTIPKSPKVQGQEERRASEGFDGAMTRCGFLKV